MRLCRYGLVALFLSLSVLSSALAEAKGHIHVFKLEPNEEFDASYLARGLKQELGWSQPASEKGFDVIVDPELGFSASDIVEGFAFGNGVTYGELPLKDGRRVACKWVAFSAPCPVEDAVGSQKVRALRKREVKVEPPPRPKSKEEEALEELKARIEALERAALPRSPR
jgi:hypothetical protein